MSFVRDNSKFVSVKGASGDKSVFGLSFSSTQRLVTCYRGLGWHGPESGHEWMGANGTDAELVIFASEDVHEIGASFHLQPFLPANTYNRLWNEESIARDITSDTFQLKLAAVRPGKNILVLRSKLPPQPPGGGDTRPICFGLRQLDLSLNN